MFKFLDKFKRKQLVKARDKKQEALYQNKSGAGQARDKHKEVKEEKAAAKVAKKEAREMKSDPWRVIYGPLTTEKTTMLGEVNQYVFRVSRAAGKIQIARAIEELYGVNVIDVNTVHIKGKQVNFGRTRGKQSDWKKAIITVAKGEKIDLYAK